MSGREVQVFVEMEEGDAVVAIAKLAEKEEGNGEPDESVNS